VSFPKREFLNRANRNYTMVAELALEKNTAPKPGPMSPPLARRLAPGGAGVRQPDAGNSRDTTRLEPGAKGAGDGEVANRNYFFRPR